MAISWVKGRPASSPAGAGGRRVDGFWKRGRRRASKNYFFQLIDFPFAWIGSRCVVSWIPRNGRAAPLAKTVKTIYTASCRLKKRRSIATRPPTETFIVNSRNTHRNAQALVGCRAFVQGVAMAPMSEHGGSEDRPDPGGSRV